MVPALLLLVAIQAQDPVRVQARLSQDEVRVGETAILRVDVETDGPRARIQRFSSLPPGIELVSTRDFDQRQFSMPGGTRRFVSREFVLRARAAGRYRIPALDVEVEGETYSTRSEILTVMAAPARARGETPAGSDGVALRAWLDADTVFVGEQVTLEVEALFSPDARMRLRRAPEYEPPSPSGFWIHDLADGGRPTRRSVGGEAYEVQRFARAFFPLAAGEYEIPPARLEYEMRRGLLYAPETHEIHSDPLPLVVLPVPGDPPPAFTGAVGEFTVRGWLEPATVPAGEAAVLTIEVEGSGNVKALPPPALPELEDVDVFPPGEEAETEARGGVIQGRKRFSWVLIPREAGRLEIPEIRYAYFDPEAGGFDVASVAPLPLDVTPGADEGPSPAAAATLRFVKTAPGGGDPLAWTRSTWFAAAQTVPLLLLAGAFVVRRRGGRDRASTRVLRRRRRSALRELEERAGGDAAAVFSEAEAFARRWLADRLGVPPARAARASTLEAHGVTAATAAALRTVLDRLAAGRYAPTPPGTEARRDIVRALGRVLDRIDDEAEAPPATAAHRDRDVEAYAPRGTGAGPRSGPGPGPGPGAGPGVTLLLAGLLALPAAAATQEAGPTAGGGGADRGDPAAAVVDGSPATVFRQGVTAFEEERFDAAARAFDAYVGLRPGDPAGWYNLGTAYHRAGHPGYAVWAWLHVPRLDPRDGDARHNLRVAGVAPELVGRVAPPVPLRGSELLLLASAAWLLAGIAGTLWVVRRRRALGFVAAAGLLAALALGGLALDSTRDARTVIVLDGAPLRAGPTMRAEALTQLPAGTGLRPVDRYGDWIRARTLAGDEGWVEASTIGRL